MFKKSIFLLVACFFISNCFSQETVAFISNFLKNKNGYLDKTIAIANPDNNNTSLFFIDGKRVYGFLINNEFEILDTLEIEDKERKYKEIIGENVLFNNGYTFYLANNSRKQFARVSFSYENNTSKFEELNLNLDNEKFLHTILYNNTVVIITVQINTSNLHFYKFENSLVPEKNTVDLSQIRFKNAKGKESQLYDLLTEGTGDFNLNTVISLVKISQNNPNTLETTSEFSKLYVHDNKVNFTFDEHKNFTQLVNINLDNYEYNFSQIDKPLLEVSEKKKKNNSFLYDDDLYFITATDEMIMLSKKNLYNSDAFKHHSAEAIDSIYFKNSPIIQTGVFYNNYRELEGTKKFLRKINKGNLGITVYKNDVDFTISYGAVQEMKNSGGSFMMPGMGAGIPMANFGAVSLFVNPLTFASSGYTISKAVKIDALFDENFDHLGGFVPENIFDLIKDYNSENNIDTKGKIVFKHNENYLLGHYDSWSRIYKLVKFK